MEKVKIETTATGWIVGDYFIAFSGLIYNKEGKQARCLPSFIFDLKDKLIREAIGL